jgi:hypothetical protein
VRLDLLVVNQLVHRVVFCAILFGGAVVCDGVGTERIAVRME